LQETFRHAARYKFKWLRRKGSVLFPASDVRRITPRRKQPNPILGKNIDLVAASPRVFFERTAPTGWFKVGKEELLIDEVGKIAAMKSQPMRRSK
jgi:hypothetical protein